ncbi:MAG: CGNR zinc finger domain-containing protein [Terracidiphilus sp.]|jgi:predicted RNA-binding Zn ribbon-like protein
MKACFPVIEAHDFVARDFVGGDAVLDFVNTVTGRDQAARDWLDGYPRLLEWAGKAKLLADEVLLVLEKTAKTDPTAATAALHRSKQLREALFAIVTGMISGKAPPEGAMALLNRYWQAGTVVHELRYVKREVRLDMRPSAIDLDVIASLIAFRFVENLLPEPRERLRICEGSNCSWLFLDHSKAGRRRWCDMAVCGNAAKSRRFYARMRDGKGVRPKRR